MWFFIGIVAGALILGLIWFLQKNHLRLTWYEWLIGIVGFGLVLFTLQNFVSSFVEIEPQAAYIFLLITGLPALILLVLAWQLAIRRTRKA
ncbi:MULTISPECIES: hypothetical protein [Dehalococcoides]|uniref:Reductive dehalogenase anchoring protein n=1 Tax=Dehalococcoides mccartyi TaxID=61435 RepID=A0A142VBM3_9CHLR|nr:MULTISPECIES: hypothetical protein [Dehalococcoides]AGG07011.1 putative reductive dehalogenase anchoring protein [Dehalococcoides mccartyi DCMB5]AMU87214.1 reductive dehalogenase anchoring protein [Dehalococcoides mccartyi]PKH45637.1 zinc ribbon domain-containing protein [Dehalococcoides mccartyi]